jgi:hypothetical protein
MEKNKCFTSGKRRYSTLGDAKIAIISTKSHNNRKGGNKKSTGKNNIKRAYYCKYCTGFHLSSKDYISSTKFAEKGKDELKNKKGLIVTKNEVMNWKHDSLPFPKI